MIYFSFCTLLISQLVLINVCVVWLVLSYLNENKSWCLYCSFFRLYENMYSCITVCFLDACFVWFYFQSYLVPSFHFLQLRLWKKLLRMCLVDGISFYILWIHFGFVVWHLEMKNYVNCVHWVMIYYQLYISIIITYDVKVELSKWVKARQVSPLPLSKQRTTVCTQIIVPLLSIFKIQKHHMIYSKVGSLVTLIMYSKFDN